MNRQQIITLFQIWKVWKFPSRPTTTIIIGGVPLATMVIMYEGSTGSIKTRSRRKIMAGKSLLNFKINQPM